MTVFNIFISAPSFLNTSTSSSEAIEVAPIFPTEPIPPENIEKEISESVLNSSPQKAKNDFFSNQLRRLNEQRRMKEKKLEGLKFEEVKNELEFMKSKVAELESVLQERDRQVEIQQRQIQTLKTQNEILLSKGIGVEDDLEDNADDKNGFYKSVVNRSELSRLNEGNSKVSHFGNGSVTITSIKKGK